MPKNLVLGMTHPKFPGKAFNRGTFSQVKKLEEAMKTLIGDASLNDLMILDDVTKEEKPFVYQVLCARLKEAGRVTITMDGERIFFITDGEVNEIRGWDIDDGGNPRLNPVER